jgi:hypothetical protein
MRLQQRSGQQHLHLHRMSKGIKSGERVLWKRFKKLNKGRPAKEYTDTNGENSLAIHAVVRQVLVVERVNRNLDGESERLVLKLMPKSLVLTTHEKKNQRCCTEKQREREQTPDPYTPSSEPRWKTHSWKESVVH